MRLVALSDTHGRVPDDVPDGDVLVHAGDACEFGTVDQVMEFSRWFNDLPHPRKLFVPGNHDSMFEFAPAEARRLMWPATVLTHEACMVDGLRFFGSPYVPNLVGWAFYRTDAELEVLFREIPPCDVLVTHGPPRGILDRVFTGESVGSEALLLAVRDRVVPRVHVFGHVHESYGSQVLQGPLPVRCYNVALQGLTSDELVRPPVVIDIMEAPIPQEPRPEDPE